MTIEPEPSEAEREAILSALAEPRSRGSSASGRKAALAEGVETEEPDP